MLRGCKLKNTETIVGLVVYAGQETKASLNNQGARFKRSKLEQQINNSVVWCIVLLFIMCFCGAIANGIWTASFSDPSAVIFLALVDGDSSSSPAMQAFINFWTYVIIYQAMIPLGLYLTIEFVKMGQIMYIEHDMQLYDPVRKTMAECKAWNITEDLGQIQYVFCDKTGTLTENEMVLKRCSINGMDYAEGKSPITNGTLNAANAPVNGAATLRSGKNHRDMSPVAFKSRDSTVQKIPMKRLQRKVGQVFSEHGQQEQANQDNRLVDYFLVLALCNSVLVSVRKAQAAATASDDVTSTPRAPSGIQMSDLIGDDDEDNNGGGFGRQDDGPEAATSLRRERREARRRQRRANQELTDQELQAAYISDSPDEAALVSAACRLGVKLVQRGPHRCVVWLPGHGPVRVRLLHTLPFDSERKRMSVVVRHPLTKELTLLTKGADSAIFSLLEAPQSNDPKSDEAKIRCHTELHLKSYANHGLRTLCLASRTLGSEEYADWLAQHRRADQSMSAGRGAALKRLACLLERDLQLLGVAGIEDRLQEGVQDTIASLRDAGMSVWVLTGDKQETALQVALEAKLRSSRQTLLCLNASESRADCRRLLNRFLDKLRRYRPPGAPEVSSENKSSSRIRPELALVVDGDTLKHCLTKPKWRRAAVNADVSNTVGGGEATFRSGAGTSRSNDTTAPAVGSDDPEQDDLRPDFLRLAEQCGSVICCRAAPRQKAAVVSLVKTKGVRTLAIGDGANDVNMIQTADVGVGISGQEGMQAVMAADFALARFRFLKRLLLVHGHWCYDRLARLALLLFYKNTLYCFLLFWYQVFNGFSGQVNIGQIYQLFFNLVMTSLPPLVMGILDKHIRADVLMANPVLYRDPMDSKGYQASHFWYNISDSVWQSLVMFMVPYFVIADSDWDIFSFGDMVIGAAVITSVLHNAIEVKGWMLVHWFSFVGSPVVGWILIAMCFSAICTNCLHPENPYYQIIRNLSNPVFWLAQAVVIPLALAPRAIYRAMDNTLSSSLTAQAMRLQNEPRYQANADMSKELRLPNGGFGIGEHDINRSMRMRSTPLLPRGSVLDTTLLEPSEQQQQQQQQQQHQSRKQES
uniref:PhoLip_ATPase_C domain-containing protein n=1 Tax=Macrostomum lignano TaxID=282301 RepID=A0A1I8IS28_9PLAT